MQPGLCSRSHVPAPASHEYHKAMPKGRRPDGFAHVKRSATDYIEQQRHTRSLSDQQSTACRREVIITSSYDGRVVQSLRYVAQPAQAAFGASWRMAIAPWEGHKHVYMVRALVVWGSVLLSDDDRVSAGVPVNAEYGTPDWS